MCHEFERQADERPSLELTGGDYLPQTDTGKNLINISERTTPQYVLDYAVVDWALPPVNR